MNESSFHMERITCLEVSFDGNTLYIGTEFGSVKKLNIANTIELKKTYEDLDNSIP